MKLNYKFLLWPLCVLGVCCYLLLGFQIATTVAERDSLQDQVDSYAFCDSLDRELWIFMESWKEPTVFVCTLSVHDDRIFHRQIGTHSLYFVNRLREK